MAVIRVSASRVVPVDLHVAYDRTITVELPQLFSRRHFAFPAVTSVYGHDDKWGRAVGQTRVVRNSDGGALTETLVAMDRPFRFAYRADGFQGPGRRVVRKLEGSWTFTPHEGGTEITWSWELTPFSALAVPVAKLTGRMWKGYAHKTLADLQALLVTS